MEWILTDIQANLEKYTGKKPPHAGANTCVKTENGCLLSFKYCNVAHVSDKESAVYLLLKDDRLILFTESKAVGACAEEISENIGAKEQLEAFFRGLTAGDIFALEHMEDRITKLEDTLLCGTRIRPQSMNKILVLRHEILKIKRYYEELITITDVLSEDRLYFSDEALCRAFAAIDRHMDRLLAYAEHLREYITQVREAYQAQIDIEQNNIMRIFTVITTVFFPLTLIAGWYGMNLKMPEFAWDYGYVFVIVLSLLVCAGTVICFKRKKWF